MPLQSLAGWQGDGIVAVVLNPADREVARDLPIPVVTFAGALQDPGVPRVMVNNPAVGRVAADHLMACGFARFGYYGLRQVAYSRSRGAGLLERLADLGVDTRADCSIHLSPSSLTPNRPWQDEMEKLLAWVSTLRPPVGLLAANDQRARMLVEACRQAGLRVPEDMAVLGVDNDQVACEFSDPPLSSIACDWYRVGFESARLLDGLIAGGKPPHADLLIDPKGVVRRRSTDVQIIDHPAVAKAAAYVREHVGENFGVEAMLRETRITRRNLELNFKRALGCTPHQYICRARVEHAKQLLLRPQRLKLTSIARQCGFHDLRRFRMVFRRVEGLSPIEFRRQHHPAGGAPA
jgi:LacI family transcriptional regulator